MSGTITEFFGYRALDMSDTAALAAAQQQCPFIHDTCTKQLSRDGQRSGVCAVKQVRSNDHIICCPHRLYANDYELLRIIARKSFGRDMSLHAGRVAVEKAREEDGAVAVFGHRWGGELRLPKRNGSGNYFADWVLAYIDGAGELREFTSIEVQTIDTTGNYHASREALLDGRQIVQSSVGLNWENVSKRIIPQLVYKGQVLQRERLCKTGLWFVTPEPVYQRIIERLGGNSNLTFGYAPQPGALHFLRYDYDPRAMARDGAPLPLTVIGEGCTTVEQVQAAFSRVRLPEAGVYGLALELALYGNK